MKALQRVMKLVLGLLRELGDESAYQRYLTCHDRVHSAQEWRRFQEARLSTKYRHGKCC